MDVQWSPDGWCLHLYKLDDWWVASDAPGETISVHDVLCHGVPVYKRDADVLQDENHEWQINTGCHSPVHAWKGTVTCRTKSLMP